MKTRIVVGLTAIALCLGVSAVAAHQVTYKGTVISTETETVRIKVVDEETKKETSMTFKLDRETKILRGDTVLTLAAARVQKDEKIAVTVDHDLDETLALVVRLDEKPGR